MNYLEYENIMIVDLEATCCNRNSIHRNDMETIEIGAVMVDRKTLSVIDEYQTFIKPLIHPKLTSFCTELTSITQSDVEGAQEFPKAFQEFVDWSEGYEDIVFCSWGQYDKNQFIKDCNYHGIEYSLKADHINLKKQFSINLNLRRNYGMAGALRYAGLKMNGTHHRGIDDARNMARLLPTMLGEN